MELEKHWNNLTTNSFSKFFTIEFTQDDACVNQQILTFAINM